MMAPPAALVADAAQLIEFAFEEALGCGEHIVLGRLAGGRSCLAVAEDAHVISHDAGLRRGISTTKLEKVSGIAG